MSITADELEDGGVQVGDVFDLDDLLGGFLDEVYVDHDPALCPEHSQDACGCVLSPGLGSTSNPTAYVTRVVCAAAGVVLLGNMTPNVSTSTDTGFACIVPCRSRVNNFPRHARLDVSHLPDDPSTWTPQQRRDLLHDLRRHMQRCGHVGSRAAKCGYRLVSRADGVTIWQRSATSPDGVESAQAHYRGIRSCGSRHECLYCARRAAHDDVARLSRAAYGHIKAGRALYLATFTMPHSATDDPAELLEVLTRAFQLFNSGRGVAPLSHHHCSGWVRSLEVTYGPNGPHFHFHVLIFREERWGGTLVNTDGSPDEVSQRLLPQLERVRVDDATGQAVPVAPLSICDSPLARWWEATAQRWVSSVHKAFKKVTGEEDRVCMVRHQHLMALSSVSTLPRYLAKQGLGLSFEMGYSVAKVGRSTGRRSPFQVLYDAATGGLDVDVQLWKQHCSLMKGRSLLTASRSVSGSALERNPFHRYAEEEVPEVPRADGWELGVASAVVLLAGWVYQSLWRKRVELEVLQAVEQLGGAAVQAVFDDLCHTRVPSSYYPVHDHADRLVGPAVDAIRGLLRQPPPPD